MPDDQSTEKSDLLERLGARVERVRPTSIVDQNQFVNVARTLDARISSSGTVVVSGNPQISSHLSGSGRVRRR